MKYLKNISIALLVCVIIVYLSPHHALASGLIPCDGGTANPCTFSDLITLFNNVINFLFYDMVLPLAGVIFVYVGWLLLSSGSNSGKRTRAKDILLNLLLGLIIALAAWIIVKVILTSLGCTDCLQLLNISGH